MSAFVPLKASSLPKASLGGTGFVPKILPKGEEGTVHSDCAATAASDQPRVELHREGDRVVGITITCSCGQVHEFECEYPAG